MTGRAHIKRGVKPAPAVVCRYPETCALCKWRRLGDLMRPLTVKEWVRVFRGRED